ncbi:dihydrofolate reductase family protein [Mariniphaga sp.]|uniref:dihydrofolate reductase family protein n=1 Tax=Mariniphaga sp. TaxID=1954475 RepID=UPI00356A3758
MERKLVLYIASSLDGYIAGENDNLNFLKAVEKEGEDYGYSEFIGTVDTVIMGRKTYDWILNHVPEFIHADKETYIITRSERPSIGNITFYKGSLTKLVSRLKSRKGKNIFCDGGAEIVNGLLKDNLIDELIISVIPVLLGSGIRLFKDGRSEQKLQLISVKSFETGLVQLHYKFCI